MSTLTANMSIAMALRSAMGITDFFCADLTPAEYLHRPVAKANCAAWTLGHLTVATRQMVGAFGVTNLPALPEGFEAKFSRSGEAPAAEEFGDTSILLPILREHIELFAKTIETFPQEKFGTPLQKPTPMFKTLLELAAFAPIHMAVHAGQITTIRRSLGRPPMV